MGSEADTGLRRRSDELPRCWRLAVALAAILFAVSESCGSGGPNLPPGEGARTQEVKSLVTCAGPRCLSPAEILEQLGFLPIEPSTLPPQFSLYERYVLRPELTESGSEELQKADPSAVAPSPTTLILAYRYLETSPLPSLLVIETRTLAGPAHLRLDDPSCGDVVHLREGTVYYGAGAGTLVADDNGQDFRVCPMDGPPGLELHTAFVAGGGIVIEIKAFPEARVTKNDILGVAASLLRELAKR